MEQCYRKMLLNSVNYLIDVRQQLFAEIVNLAMKGEFSDIDDVIDLGYTYEFHLQHFKDSEDINVQKLVELILTLETTVDSLINLNRIEDDELTANNNYR